MPTTEQLEEVRSRLRWDTPFWARNCATILNDERVPVRLEARPWQVTFDRALERQREQGMPMRAIILKARKLGFSTWVQAKFMQRVTQQPFQYAIVAAHLRSAASQLADMASLMYDRLPTDQDLGMGFSVRPHLIGKGSSRQGSRWIIVGDRARPSEASVYETLTAGAKGGGRASTPSMFHGSEVAHYEDPQFLIGALNAVPKRPETIVVLESTANGFNHFHDRWQRAVEGAEDPDTGGLYAPLFFGWQDNPFNAMRFGSEEARARFGRTVGDPDGGGDEEEPWLVEQFGCSLEQLRWRRVTRDEECGGKVELFHQEHPATPEQAFIGSGNPVFSQILVSRMIRAAEQAHEPVQGVLRPVDVVERRLRTGSILVPQRAMWVPSAMMRPDDSERWGSRGLLRVWEHPLNEATQAALEDAKRKPDGQYVVFVDVAQGMDTTAEVRDWTAIQVLDHLTRMQVASYRSRVAVHDLPELALLVALYFNQAWLAVEKTGLGIGVVDSLVKDYRYPRMYRTRLRGDVRADGTQGDLVGWSTDPRTKPLMEMTMGEVLKTGTHGCRCLSTAREFTTYVESDKGKHGAQKGANDDLVMSFMGAHRVAGELRPRVPGKGGRRSGRGRMVSDDITGYGY